MDQISPVAWVVIIFFLLFIIGLNVSLFNALRSQSRTKMKMDRTSSQTVDSMRRLGAVLRDPLADERSQINTLSNLVEKLENHHSAEPDPNDAEDQSAIKQDQQKKL